MFNTFVVYSDRKFKHVKVGSSFGSSQLHGRFIDVYRLTPINRREYYPDFDQMLFVRALSGCTFRKVYMDPIKKRPISRFLTGMDFIVSNDALSLSDCGRKTHKIMMRHSTLKRMQVAGQYRDVPLVTPTEAPDNAETTIKNIEGLSLINIDYSKIKADPKVVKYYEKIK
jgi:hypothetical protein